MMSQRDFHHRGLIIRITMSEFRDRWCREGYVGRVESHGFVPINSSFVETFKSLHSANNALEMMFRQAHLRADPSLTEGPPNASYRLHCAAGGVALCQRRPIGLN